MQLTHQLEKDVGCKVLQFSSHDEYHKAPWLQNPTVYKRNNFMNRKMNWAYISDSQYACEKLLH